MNSIQKYYNKQPESILDIGCAEGFTLTYLKQSYPKTKMIGIDLSQELIDKNTDPEIKLMLGDALKLPFANETFDIIIATAIIEHVENPALMLKEAKRVLKKEGLIILTTPDMFYERIARFIGALTNDQLLKAEVHKTMFNLKKLKRVLIDAGFDVLTTEKFMMSPIGMPQEKIVEKILKYTKLDFLMLNQLAVARKP